MSGLIYFIAISMAAAATFAFSAIDRVISICVVEGLVLVEACLGLGIAGFGDSRAWVWGWPSLGLVMAASGFGDGCAPAVGVTVRPHRAFGHGVGRVRRTAAPRCRRRGVAAGLRSSRNAIVKRIRFEGKRVVGPLRPLLTEDTAVAVAGSGRGILDGGAPPARSAASR